MFLIPRVCYCFCWTHVEFICWVKIEVLCFSALCIEVFTGLDLERLKSLKFKFHVNSSSRLHVIISGVYHHPGPKNPYQQKLPKKHSISKWVVWLVFGKLYAHNSKNTVCKSYLLFESPIELNEGVKFLFFGLIGLWKWEEIN